MDLVPRGGDQSLGDVLETDSGVPRDRLDALALQAPGERLPLRLGPAAPQRVGETEHRGGRGPEARVADLPAGAAAAAGLASRLERGAGTVERFAVGGERAPGA